MGKKANKRKQKQPNQRGYATSNNNKAPSSRAAPSSQPNNNGKTPTAASSSKGSVSVSTQNHHDLLDLMGALDDQDTTTTSTNTDAWISPDKFYKKVSHIYDTLTQVGFSWEDVQRVVVALGYSITLERSLDWLCLHLKTKDLPPLFTEGTVRQQQSPSKASSLTLLKPTAARVDSGCEAQATEELNFPPVATLVQEDDNNPPKTQAPKEDEKDTAAKAWILKQYQYEDHEDDDNKQDEETDAPPMPQSEKPPSPNEIRLAQLEQQLQEDHADAYNDASNYMRSKQEIKQLQNNVKKLRKQVQALEKKVQKERAEAADACAETTTTSTDPQTATNDDDDNYGGEGFFGSTADEEDGEFCGGFFDAPAPAPAPSPAKEKEPPAPAPPKPPSSDPIVPKDSIPSGWTGKTPRDALTDWCKKEKIRKPQFFKLPGWNGARIRIDTKPTPLQMQTDNRMGSYLDAQHYLAAKALYQLNPHLPLYRLFPPYHRDLWKSWSHSERSVQNAQKQERDDALQAKIQSLVDLVPPLKPIQPKPAKGPAKGVQTEEQKVAEQVLASWEDDDDDNDDNNVDNAIANLQLQKATAAAPQPPKQAPSKNAKSSITDKAMQSEFLRRKASPAYQAMLQVREALPMYAFREQILKTVQTNSVTILCAETGAGKTTQCPQFLLEESLSQGTGDRTNVICTQPRRVAATSVAERVAEEMAEPAVGEMVGYQIRMEARRSPKTRLLFCTTGVVLRRLQDDPTLKGVSHICVDEVHERQYQVDCLLVILRQMLRTTRPDLKVILMSATLDANLFSSFFGGAPVMNVPGRTFPVATYHLEDLLDGTGHIIEEDSRYAIRNTWGKGGTASIEISTRGGEKRKEVHSLESSGVHLVDVSNDYPGYKMSTQRSMDRVNEEILNYDLIEDVLQLLLVEPDRNEILLSPEGASHVDGSVLVFLPGFGEIKSLTERLEASRSLGDKSKFDIIPMHSTLSPQNQRRAFLKPKKGCRKIILSTNIAETSVTIPDVVVVVDAGRVREVRVDKRTSTSRLVTDWCSKASAKQRAGRAGRVQPGICLKLYSSRTATVTMHAASQPEIRRVPLEDVCINILAGSFADNCWAFLNQMPQPPAEEAVGSALRILHDVGAITMVADESKGKTYEQLTPLGRHLAKLPVDVRLGKMLIFGSLFKVIDPVLTVAASLSCKSVFSAFVKDALQAKARHKLFAHPQSDFLTLCNVWDAYDKAASQGMSKARKFCYDNYLSFSSLREIGDSRRHFMELLFGIGFLDRSLLSFQETTEGKRMQISQALLSSPYNANKNNFDVVHSVICAGLYPNVGHLVPNMSGSGERKLWHKNEQLHFHTSSVNSSLKTTHRYPTSWIAFHEKFGTQHRVSVSTTCFVHPFAILMFGGELVVQHTNRKVVVDDWIELPMAAQTGVLFREVRKQVGKLLEGFLQIKSARSRSCTIDPDGSRQAVLDGVVRLLSTEIAKQALE